MPPMSIFLDILRSKAATLLEKGDQVFLYGSRARNTADEDSDWDLIVITEREYSFKDSFDKYVYPLVVAGIDRQQDVSVFVYSKNEWEQRKGQPFYNNVSRDFVLLS